MAVQFSPLTLPTFEPRAPKSEPAAEGPAFGASLVDALSQARAAEKTSETEAVAMANGEADLHSVMIAQERAGVAVRFAVTAKTKALDAYRELMNTPV